MKEQICKYCDEPFVPQWGHPGLINVCLESECQEWAALDGVKDPEPLTACVAWSGKHTMEISITPYPEVSSAFNNAQRRFGAGPMMVISNGISPKARVDKREAGVEIVKDNGIKEGTSKGYADPGSLYWSKLGECRSVKR
jgi:hypothetical protein